MQRTPFGEPRYQLPAAAGQNLTLEPVDEAAASQVAEAMAGMDPWRTLGIGAAALAQSLTSGDEHLHRWLIRREAALAGTVIVRNPWLYGPYLALLAILPEQQGSSIGTAVLRWMEREAGDTAGNIWACVSAFNTRAQQFYEKHGFEKVGTLDGLVRPGFAELLIRKRLR